MAMPPQLVAALQKKKGNGKPNPFQAAAKRHGSKPPQFVKDNDGDYQKK